MKNKLIKHEHKLLKISKQPLMDHLKDKQYKNNIFQGRPQTTNSLKRIKLKRSACKTENVQKIFNKVK